MIAKQPHVTLYPASPMTAADVLDSGARHVLVATGAVWRRDGRGRSLGTAISGWETPGVLTLDDDLLPAREDGRLDSLRRIGDADAPNLIAQSVFAGHLAAREFGELLDPDAVPFRRERASVHGD